MPQMRASQFDMRRACCKAYTIRLDVEEFALSKPHRQLLRKWRRHLQEEEEPGSGSGAGAGGAFGAEASAWGGPNEPCHSPTSGGGGGGPGMQATHPRRIAATERSLRAVPLVGGQLPGSCNGKERTVTSLVMRVYVCTACTASAIQGTA